MKRGIVLLLGMVALAGPQLVPQAQVLTGTPALPAGRGTIQGVVLREGTTQPLSDVQITLNLRSEVSEPGPTQLTALSDQAGHFVFTNVPAGTQRVMAQLDGYFVRDISGNLQTISAKTVPVVAEQMAKVQFEMIPGAGVSGRVFDPSGRPLAESEVQILRTVYTNGVPALQTVGTKTTDDRGEYRFYRLAPGEYFLAAVPARARARAGTAALESAIPTFYPNASDRSAALPLTLRAGDETTGIVIQAKAGHTLKISGKVINPFPPDPVTNVAGQTRPPVMTVVLIPRSTNGVPDTSGGTAVTARQSDGFFEIPDVLPGVYDLLAHIPIAAFKGWGAGNPPATANSPWGFGRTAVEVRDANVENVSVVMRYGNDLNGRLIIDGRPAAANVRISVIPDSETLNSPEGQTANTFRQISIFQAPIAPDGSFTIPLLPEGRFRFQIVIGAYAPPAPRGRRGLAAPANEPAAPAAPLPALPATAYVADIRQGGASVYDNGIVIGTDVIDPIDVLVNSVGGSVEGELRTADGKPATAMIVLVPPENRRQNGELYKTTRADAQGRFQLVNIPPGLYTLYAWQSIPSGAYQNKEYLARFAGRGVPVVVQSGVRASAEVRLIPAAER